MQDFWQEITANKIIWVTFFSWLIAQSAKIFLGAIKEKRFNFYWLLGTGGMPSSHSAAVSALAICIGQEMGFASAEFALAGIFAFITMFDAQTWRRSIGVQARILNHMMEDDSQDKKQSEKRLRELVGHTPVEVFVGSAIGVLAAMFWY